MTTAVTPHVATPGPRLSRRDRAQPVLLVAAIGVGLAIGRASPDLGRRLGVGVPAGVFVLITLVMLGVNGSGVLAAWRRRRFVVAAIGINFVVNPFLAWGLGRVFLAGHPELRVGLVLFLVTPCIGWYLVFTDLAGGDTDLAVAVLGVNIALQVVLLPVYLRLLVDGPAAPPSEIVATSVVIYLIAPAGVAAVLRRVGRRMGAGHDRLVAPPWSKPAVLVVVIVSMFASQANALLDEIAVVRVLAAPVVTFFVVAFVVAAGLANAIGLRPPEAIALVFTSTSRNSEASLAIAATAFASPLVGLTVALGPVFELPLLVLMVRLLRARV